MNFNNRNQTINILSMQSDEMNQIQFFVEQSCGIINDLQSKDIKEKDKKEIIKMSEDKDGGIESGIESLTVVKDLLGTYSELVQMMTGKLEKQLSKVSKKLLETEKIQ